MKTIPKYPVHECIDQIRECLAKERNLILTASPGAGKSTIVPVELLNEPWLQGKRILMLQPRRVAAIAIARRMAEITGTRPGTLIGHQVRFSRNISSDTQIEILTEGILTRRIQNDPFLENVALVIFDEFHERSIHSDLCLALCREIQKDVRPDLKIMVMSATVSPEPIANFLDTSSVIDAPGFLFPVETSYQPVPAGHDRFSAMLTACRKIFSSSPPDESYLIFLPGSGEINFFKRELESNVSSHEILPLYGSMSLDEQQKVLTPAEKPRIVLATNIAETSLTIEGITTVIDSGYCRKLSFNPETGLERLDMARISKASAAQRAGRAGRLKPGRAFRLWSQSEHMAMENFDLAEIHSVDLCSTILELAGWGINQPENFAWFEAPEIAKTNAAQNLLFQLRAIDESGGITESGKSFLKLPVHPRLACMLLNAKKLGIGKLASRAAAIISEKDFIVSPAITSQEKSFNTDIFARLDILERKNEAQPDAVDKRQVKHVLKVSQQLEQMLDFTDEKNDRSEHATESLKICMAAAFPDRICQLRNSQNKRNYKICTGQGFSLPDGRGEPFIIALRLDARLRKGSNEGQIFLAAEIGLESVLEVIGHLCQGARELYFSEARKAVSVKNVIRYLDMTIKDSDDKLSEQERILAEKMLVGHALANFQQAFNLDAPENRNFINRVNLIAKNTEDPEFPIIDQKWFFNHIESLTAGCTSFSELQQMSFFELYFSGKPFSLKTKLEKLAPERLKVPSGNLLKIEYPDDGNPFLQVKIQEVFGMKETPKICNNRVKLILHLLSPAMRPVQITSDLESFWKNGYKTVVAELKGRYPKHQWPEDPATGIAFAGTKKQLERKIRQN